MSRHCEIVRRSLDLVETVGEGIDHIKANFEKGEFEASLPLLQGVAESLLCVLKAGFLVLGEKGFNDLSACARTLQAGLESLAGAYEARDWGAAASALKGQVAVGYVCFKAGAEKLYGRAAGS